MAEQVDTMECGCVVVLKHGNRWYADRIELCKIHSIGADLFTGLMQISQAVKVLEDRADTCKKSKIIKRVSSEYHGGE